MPNTIAIEAMTRPNEFLAEVARSNGKDSMQYTWALSVVAEMKAEIAKARGAK
jgi:hypothetical protein